MADRTPAPTGDTPYLPPGPEEWGTVTSILNRGFSNGQPWDRTWWRKALFLWWLPLCGLVIAVSAAAVIYEDLTANYPVGYVVSNDEDCTLVVAARPDGPPVDTIEQNSGGKFGTCGGLDRNYKVYYDPGRGIQAFGPEDQVVGIPVVGLAVLACWFPALMAWIDTLRKRRGRRRPPADGLPTHTTL